jgi:homocitrate synthase NifV
MAMDKTFDWVFEAMQTLIPYAKSYFERVYVGAQDASRADPDFLNRFVERALYLGTSRIRIADTVGILNPVSVAALFSGLSKDFPDADFEFHSHNDMGMATANALTALLNGASGVSCTVNGLGERAGNAALEELLIAMDQSAQMKNIYDLSVINILSKKVETFSGYQLHASKPIVGENAFSHETGIHTRCMLSNKLSYQPFDERIVGNKSHKIVFGKHSGKASIERFFMEKGIVLNSLQLMLIMNQLKDLALRTKSAVSDYHLFNVYHNIVS